MPIKRLLVANRGEIAVRIIRASRELGINTIQAYSEADANSLPVKLADEAVFVGQAPAPRSYLNIEAITGAALKTQADAIHPGYGFLAENAQFAEAVEKAGLTFVGPHSTTIEIMGDKAKARQAAHSVGLATVPGSPGRVENMAEAEDALKEIGFPVLIKAAAGGGGRGIRTAHSIEEFRKLAPQARQEAKNAFGDAGIYLEALVRNARHVEVQIVGDGTNAVHYFERECSLQRRRQKIWEEAPASNLPAERREDICQAAAEFAASIGYKGAGTLEFLYDPYREQFYFLEMNTRIQVEHPVTEFVTGVDLVREAIRVADGAPISRKQRDIFLNGHSIECRINAEDPANGFMPSPGTINSLTVPGGPGVRFDTMLFPGCSIPPFYDSLVGKLVVWDECRASAIRRMHRALSELSIEGIKTTTPLHMALCWDPDVIGGNIHTAFLDGWLAAWRTRSEEKGGNC